jgi:L-fuculose-phosphate aldolase
MSATEQELRRQIVDVGKLVFNKGWVASNDGNISIRLDDGTILCTPTGVSKGMMDAGRLIVCDPQGRKLRGGGACTTEIAMHTTIYALRPDVRSIVHAHPPVSTGFAAAGRPLNLAILPEVVVGLGCVPLAAYGLPGTTELTEGMLPFIPKYDAILLENHGVVCNGDDVYKAYFRMETVEHFARIALVAELLGGARVLPRVEVEKLFASRDRYGVKSAASFEPGCPVVAEDLQPQRKYELTRDEILSIIDEALRARGVVPEEQNRF